MDKNWILWDYNNKEYLHNKVLIYQHFSDSGSNHYHCELCWARFSSFSEDLHSGYYEQNSKSWICDDCYSDFKDLFGWTVK